MTKDEIIKALRDMAKYPTVTLPRDCEALRMAANLLEQPEQEPVAWRWGVPKLKTGDYEWRYSLNKTRPNAIPLYTTPPQRKPLTDEEVNKLVDDEDWYNDPHGFARAIEAAHGIKGEA